MASALSFLTLCLWLWLLAARYDKTEWDGRFKLSSEYRTSGLAFNLAACLNGFAFGFYGTLIGSIMIVPMFRKTDHDTIFRRFLLNTVSGGLSLALCNIPVELQILWNHLDGVGGMSSTGQVLSLTIGSFSLLRALWLISKRDSEEANGQIRGDIEAQDPPPNTMANTVD